MSKYQVGSPIIRQHMLLDADKPASLATSSYEILNVSLISILKNFFILLAFSIVLYLVVSVLMTIAKYAIIWTRRKDRSAPTTPLLPTTRMSESFSPTLGLYQFPNEKSPSSPTD